MPLIHNPSLIQECPDHELGDITEPQYYGDDILDMPIPTEEDDMRYLHLEDQQDVEGSDDNNPWNWDDVLISKQGVKVKFIIDSVKDVAWKEYQDEVNFLKENLKRLICDRFRTTNVTSDNIFEYVFGENSNFAKMF
jgi:hypothetical protein